MTCSKQTAVFSHNSEYLQRMKELPKQERKTEKKTNAAQIRLKIKSTIMS